MCHRIEGAACKRTQVRLSGALSARQYPMSRGRRGHVMHNALTCEAANVLYRYRNTYNEYY